MQGTSSCQGRMEGLGRCTKEDRGRLRKGMGGSSFRGGQAMRGGKSLVCAARPPTESGVPLYFQARPYSC